ncbi:sister chromatid cohesion 1 protein 1 [Dorcoceras hygrometricum]|uniref:Sister chromatid cohesion 1 protein 1 n=1 Tax=Dorcoceras hygrometricum TaxID=472368 RepID=A0A2Z7BXH5_9LAMI|nr:sister chromatid cohesion 1 protein 1 [Dorcoceras hygrometricum]
MHAKINRRKLDKLNIIKICEEILNPSVPMALRLSGILMGGVVIVYERKVKLLYDDVTRLLVEINEAWKIRSAPSDPTRLPKGKAQAKFEAVTLPKNHDIDLGEIEHLLPQSNATIFVDFQQSYIAMSLDKVDDPCNHQNPGDFMNQDHHQAEAANITLCDNYDSHRTDTYTFNRFERFDIGVDEDTQLNFTPPEHTGIPNSLMPSPPFPEEPLKPDENIQHPKEQANQQNSDESKLTVKALVKRRPAQRGAKRTAALIMDNDQTIIPGPIYQSWLQNSSSIISGRTRKRKPSLNPMATMKASTLMDLPSVVLMEGLFTNGNRQVHYPTPLLELWIKSTQPALDSPSGRTSHHHPPEPSSSSPTERLFMVPLADVPQGGSDSQSMNISIEKQRANVFDNGMPPEIITEAHRSNLKINRVGLKEAHGVMATPGNSGDDIRSIPSSGSGHGFFSHNSDGNSGRSGKKRPYSASKNSENGLEPVAEEFSWHHPDPNFKLAKLSEYGSTPDLMVETGPTQTQNPPTINQPHDHITDSIRMHLKTHFDTPGTAKTESLNHLAFGMNKKRVSCLFYQTCGIYIQLIHPIFTIIRQFTSRDFSCAHIIISWVIQYYI